MEDSIPMSTLSPGESGTVDTLTLSDVMRSRMRDSGVTAGTQVVCVGCSPMGDPAAFRIRGAIIALRRADCAHILLRR